MWMPADGELTEDELHALRAVCLIQLDENDVDERLSQHYDRYGEGDDKLLKWMMNLAQRLEDCPKDHIMGEFAYISKIRPRTRNK